MSLRTAKIKKDKAVMAHQLADMMDRWKLADDVRAEVYRQIVSAYERGARWAHENPDCPEYIAKAAYDYADKTTSSDQNG